MKISRRIISVICIAWLFIGCPRTHESAVERETTVSQAPSTLAIIDDPGAQQDLLLTLAKAYPDKITDVAFINDDWTMLVKGVRFYFARGRFLPETLRKDWEKYLPFDFYVYPWIGTEKQRQIAYQNPVYSTGSSFLFDTLYGAATENNAWELQEKCSFLGVKLLIHRDIKPALERVDARVTRAAKTNRSIRRWIAELQTGVSNYGWSWRPIAGTNRRSNHSYGTAIDLLPVDLKGRETYWRWKTDDETDNEEEVTYYLPPEAVIKAFEAEGFIWGGKWDLIDTMHFEYRPEILLLNE